MFDHDLAALYGTSTRRLNEQVRRNRERFPEDFGFPLTREERGHLISQNATSSHGGRRKPPWVFTEHGAVMLASVLRTRVAVLASLEVVRAFIRLRALVSSHRELVARLDDLERRYDRQFRVVFDAIRSLIEPDEPLPRERIGFRPKAEPE